MISLTRYIITVTRFAPKITPKYITPSVHLSLSVLVNFYDTLTVSQEHFSNGVPSRSDRYAPVCV